MSHFLRCAHRGASTDHDDGTARDFTVALDDLGRGCGQGWLCGRPQRAHRLPAV